MAAPSASAVRTALKGLRLVPGRWLQSCRVLHGSVAASQSSSGPEAQRGAGQRERPEEDREEGPEYIPRRKAKSPMTMVGYAWIIGLPSGVIGFILAKKQVDKNRLKQLKIRQRMKTSNDGEYERSRYRRSVDQ